MSQSLSNAPQPPSLFCIASSQRLAAGDRALPGEVVGLAGELRAREGREDFGGVVGVGVPLVGVLEVPAAGLGRRGRPSCQSPIFLTSLSSSQRAAFSIAGSSAGVPPSERASMTSAVSQTGEKQGWRWSVSSSSSSSFSSSWTWASEARVVERVAEAAERDDRVDDRREDRAEPVGEGQALVDPGLAGRQGLLAIGSEAAGFEAFQEVVDAGEETRASSAPCACAPRAARSRGGCAARRSRRIRAPGRTAWTPRSPKAARRCRATRTTSCRC